jgi:hypothetical protein
MKTDQECWAEALAIEHMHGANARRFVAERIGALALAGDAAGVQRFKKIAECLESLVRVPSDRPN